jgi:hypothetical protein
MALTSKTGWRVHPAYPIAALMLASVAAGPARADFFDDVRRTFQTDIPHFFQDDIPCAFGGQPTSHTRASCRGSDRPAKHATDKNAIAPPPAQTRPPEGFRTAPEYP